MPKKKDAKGRYSPDLELRKTRLEAILKMLKEGKSCSEIGMALGISRQAVSQKYIPYIPGFITGLGVDYRKRPKKKAPDRIEAIQRKHGDMITAMTPIKMETANLAQLATASKMLLDQEKTLGEKSPNGFENYLRSWKRLT